MWVNGKITKKMVLAHLLLQTVKSMWVSGKMTLNTFVMHKI